MTCCNSYKKTDNGALLTVSGTDLEKPSWVARVARVVADLWQCDLDEVSRQTEENFRRYLG